MKPQISSDSPVVPNVLYNSTISIAARGIYAVHCAILEDGDKATSKQMADLCGLSEAEYFDLLDELVERGIMK